MHEVVVANGRYLGGGMKMCPEASPDDGLFDVLVIGDVTKADLVKTMPKIYRGTHLPHPKAELLRGAAVSVDSEEPLPDPARRRAAGNDPGAVRGRPPGAAPARAGLSAHSISRGASRSHRSISAQSSSCGFGYVEARNAEPFSLLAIQLRVG